MNLLISPLAVLEQWTDAAVRSRINVYRMSHKNEWEPIGTHTPKTSFLFITHYDFVVRHLEELQTTIWNRLILDEAHRISNVNTQLFHAIVQIPATVKWAITATPVINGLNNVSALFQFLGMDKSQIPKSEERLAPIVYEKVLCRTVAELRPTIASLPQKEVTVNHILPFSTKDERDFYRGIQGGIVRRWAALQDEGAGHYAYLKLLLVLRQISVHPQVYIEARRREFPNYSRQDWTEDSTKFMALKELLASQKEDHRWIIFCSFHDEMNLLKKTLTALPRVRRVQIYSGKQNQQEREEIIKNTKEPLNGSNEILMISSISGERFSLIRSCLTFWEPPPVSPSISISKLSSLFISQIYGLIS
jgi:SNF2 family DNA or RNA helicase